MTATAGTGLWRDVALCVTFFTRLPVAVPSGPPRDLASALWAAPVAGWLVGLAGGAALLVGDWLGVPHGPAAALALVVTLAVTGGLHEDGLADTADGFGGGRDRVRKLEIMRDSRIGSYGATALGLSLLLRWSALSAIPDAEDAAMALILAHGASRGLLPLFLNRLPPARTDGASAGAGSVNIETARIALAIGGLPLVAFGLSDFVGAALALTLVFLLFSALCRRQIGGQTGDTAGALQQLAEATLLLAAATVPSA